MCEKEGEVRVQVFVPKKLFELWRAIETITSPEDPTDALLCHFSHILAEKLYTDLEGPLEGLNVDEVKNKWGLERSGEP